MKHKFLSILIVVIVLLAIVALPASAASPVRWVADVDETGSVDIDCGFPVKYHSYGQIRSVDWFDDEGNFYQGHKSNGQLREDWYHEAGGKVLKVLVQGPLTIQSGSADGAIWFFKFRGTTDLILVPGRGPVSGMTGLVVVGVNYITGEVWIAKQAHYFNFDAADTQAICDYLAP
jgi:hypothetical protein